MKKGVLGLLFVLLSILGYGQASTINEGFENWPLSGWSIFINGAGVGWVQDWQGVSNTGVHSAYSSINNNLVDNWMVSPQVSITNSDYELKFFEMYDDTQYYSLSSVLISTTTASPATGNYTQIFTTPDTAETWTERIVDLSAYVGQNVYIAFRYEGTWHEWFIDDVTIQPDVFTDAKINYVQNPTGVSLTTSLEDVTINIENNGTDTINTIDVDWWVNATAQSTFSSTNFNLLPQTDTNLVLGSFLFGTSGMYQIEAGINALGDFDLTNDSITSSYSITSGKDANLYGVMPEGMTPITGLQDVTALITNEFINTIDSVEISWMINGNPQTVYQNNALNLAPGASAEVVIGQYNFPKGVHEIEVNVMALGDSTFSNNEYLSYAAVDTVWESFEERLFPPQGWEVGFGLKEDASWDIGPLPHANWYYSSFPDSNYFGVVSDTILTPLLDIVTGDELKFTIKTSAFLAASHKVIWINGTTGAVQVIQNITSTPDVWTQVIVDISAAAGTNYIGITSSVSSFPGHSKFDLITSTASTHHDNYDLKAQFDQFYYLAKQNQVTTIGCKIKNIGSNQILGSDYTVQLMKKPGIVLATANGITINPWEEISVPVNHTFTTIETNELYFEIVYAADQNPSNNTSQYTLVGVVPNTVVIEEVGEPVIPGLNFPFNSNGNTNSLGEDDLSQTLYSKNDVTTAGNIYGIIYTYNNLLGTEKKTHLPLKISIAQTNAINLNAGWISNANLQVVFDDTIEVVSGFANEMYIPFDSVIPYSALNNIVIQAYQYDPEWPPAILRFLYEDLPLSGQKKTISVMDYYNLDPLNPPTAFNASEDYAHTQFVIEPIVDYCSVSGTVYGTGSVPLQGASISVNGTSISVSTNASGNYALPDLTYGNYTLSVSNFGYNDSVKTVTLNTPTLVQDFYLNERTQITVTGNVVGNNAPTIPLANVTVSAVGYTTDNTATDGSGNFTLTNIFGVSTYEVTLKLYGYYDTTVIVNAVSTNINLGTIVMEQEFISPYDVNVETNGGAVIRWKDPLESYKGKLQNDYGQTSFSYTNEPNENVSLGNFFWIYDTTTITSVEIQTDVYVNATDYATIEIYDSSATLIATSDPFLMYVDSLITIDIPNIVVYSEIFVMVHWENNAASTNALAIDFSDTTIENTAVIKYPNQPIYLFTDFIGGGAPNMSFLVRVNTLEEDIPLTNEEDLTFNIYRGLADEFPILDNWQKINTAPVSGTSYAEPTWSVPSPSSMYRYAVETIYTNGNSEVTFSNEVVGSILGVLDVNGSPVEVSIFPNPATDFLTFSVNEAITEEIEVSIYNSVGQKADNFKITPGLTSMSRNVGSLAPGMYYLNLNIGNSSFSKKVIIK